MYGILQVTTCGIKEVDFMNNWFVNKDETILKTVGSAMAELESIVEDERTTNYWIDNTHNIFAFVNNNGDTEDDDKWIEIHFDHPFR